MKPYAIGIDVGGTKIATGLLDRSMNVLSVHVTKEHAGRLPAQVVDAIERAYGEVLQQAGISASQVAGVGLSFAGHTNGQRGVVLTSSNMPQWDQVPLRDIVSKRLNQHVLLDNDTNLGVLAEHRYGAGHGFDNMVFLTMGTGLGAGIIVDGRLYHGTDDLAGEIGHVRLTRGGPVGHNKRGSAEGWASGSGIEQIAKRAVADARRRGCSTILTAHRETVTARDVCAAAKRGDVVAMRIVRSTGERLGQVLAILVDILNPERIVIGGLAMRTGEMMLGPARAVMAREALPASARSCQIVPAALGERIGDVAALCVAMEL